MTCSSSHSAITLRADLGGDAFRRVFVPSVYERTHCVSAFTYGQLRIVNGVETIGVGDGLRSPQCLASRPYILGTNPGEYTRSCDDSVTLTV